MALLLVATHLISPVRADASAGWLSQASPQVSTVAQLPANQSPGLSNRDCTQQTFKKVDPNNGRLVDTTDCMVQTTLGNMAQFGSPAMFSGTSAGIEINPDYPYLLQPIPNQGMTLATSSAPVTGSYLHFYTDVTRHLTQNSAGFGGPLLSYTVNADPDFSLRDKVNALLPTNASGTLSYSSDGNWMLVDTPGGSFIRVNLATFDVLPFAPSLNKVGDYSNYFGETAISDDGRYAAVASDNFTFFRVYDLSTCTGSTNNNYSQPLDCQSRNYWPDMPALVPGFKAIYALRFINDDNISMTATYKWQSNTSYDVAKFTVTAPGKTAHNLDYLALGDSYISGEGEFEYKSGTDTGLNTCHQSPLSYPFSIGADLYNQYNSAACSGAETKDITGGGLKDYNADPGGAQSKGESAPSYDNEIFTNFELGYRKQLQFVQRYQPSVVTLSIGGNDIGFGKILQKCIEDDVLNKSCFDSYDERMLLISSIDKSYQDIRDTYQAILSADPGVQLYVVGYPQIVTQGSCGKNVRLNANDINMAQNLIDYLDKTIQRAANSAGARYVDIQNALAGHRLCEASAADIAMNGVTAGNDRGAAGVKFLGAETYHPNVLGHQLIAQAILQQTNNFKQSMPGADLSIKAPKPTDPEAVALLSNYQYSGHVAPLVIAYADGATSDIIYRTVGSSVSIGSSFGLKANTGYQVSLDGNTVGNLGTFTTDANGSLNFSLALPASTSTGYHALTVNGTNRVNQTVEVYTLVYVAASQTDLNGDGMPDATSQCVAVPDSGIDADGDGIDDACDPIIAGTPQIDYSSRVYLIGNSVQATRQ